MTAFYNTPYYCHECKKTYTKRDKCPSKCLPCFTFIKEKNVKEMKLFVINKTENFLANNVLKIIYKIDQKIKKPQCLCLSYKMFKMSKNNYR